MKKFIVIVSLVVLLLSTGVFTATFINANDDKTEPEIMKLKGSLVFENRMHPELNVDGKIYELMIPHFVISDLKINNNDAVELEGFLEKEHRGYYNDSDEYIVVVTTLTFNGKTVDIRKLMDEQRDRDDFMRGPGNNRRNDNDRGSGCRGRGWF